MPDASFASASGSDGDAAATDTYRCHAAARCTDCAYGCATGATARRLVLVPAVAVGARIGHDDSVNSRKVFIVSAFPSKICFYGCGNMGGAMLRGWLAADVAPATFHIIDPVADNLPEGVHLHRSSAALDTRFDVVILGIKPQLLTELAPEIGRILNPGATVISILAGTRTDTLSACFPDARVILDALGVGLAIMNVNHDADPALDHFVLARRLEGDR